MGRKYKNEHPITLGCTIETSDTGGRATRPIPPANPGDWGVVRLIVGNTIYYRSNATGRMRRESHRNCHCIGISQEEISDNHQAVKRSWTPEEEQDRWNRARRMEWSEITLEKARWCDFCGMLVMPSRKHNGGYDKQGFCVTCRGKLSEPPPDVMARVRNTETPDVGGIKEYSRLLIVHPSGRKL